MTLTSANSQKLIRTHNQICISKKQLPTKKKLSKIGYDRVKEKVKWKHTVNENTGPGSGKVAIDNWNELEQIRGGSPATISFSNGITSVRLEDISSENEFGTAEMDDVSIEFPD